MQLCPQLREMYRPMQRAQQWSAAEFRRVSSCEAMRLITCLPADCGFPAPKNQLCRGEKANKRDANANEFSFNHDQMCLHLVNRVVKI